MAAGNPQAPDLERLIQRAAKGDQSALVETCQRYRVPVLAAALNAGVSWDEAVALVGPTLRLLCTQLLLVGLLVAANERLVGAVRAAGPGDETNGGSETP